MGHSIPDEDREGQHGGVFGEEVYLFKFVQFISTLLPHNGGDHGLIEIALKQFLFFGEEVS